VFRKFLLLVSIDTVIALIRKVAACFNAQTNDTFSDSLTTLSFGVRLSLESRVSIAVNHTSTAFVANRLFQIYSSISVMSFAEYQVDDSLRPVTFSMDSPTGGALG
jgi:hypothetical protein